MNLQRPNANDATRTFNRSKSVVQRVHFLKKISCLVVRRV